MTLKNSHPKFAVEQMAAALRASRGIPSHAAEILRTELGTTCSVSTVVNYCRRHPELEAIREEYRARLIGASLSNLARAIEVDRDPNISLRVLDRLLPNWSALWIKTRGGGAIAPETREALQRLSIAELRVLEGIYAKLEQPALPVPAESES
jgi:hypothetical protein